MTQEGLDVWELPLKAAHYELLIERELLTVELNTHTVNHMMLSAQKILEEMPNQTATIPRLHQLYEGLFDGSVAELTYVNEVEQLTNGKAPASYELCQHLIKTLQAIRQASRRMREYQRVLAETQAAIAAAAPYEKVTDAAQRLMQIRAAPPPMTNAAQTLLQMKTAAPPPPPTPPQAAPPAAYAGGGAAMPPANSQAAQTYYEGLETQWFAHANHLIDAAPSVLPHIRQSTKDEIRKAYMRMVTFPYGRAPEQMYASLQTFVAEYAGNAAAAGLITSLRHVMDAYYNTTMTHRQTPTVTDHTA